MSLTIFAAGIIFLVGFMAGFYALLERTRKAAAVAMWLHCKEAVAVLNAALESGAATKNEKILIAVDLLQTDAKDLQ